MLGGDAFVRSAYVWRGLTRSSGWVLQPDAYLAVGNGAAWVTAGWWTTVEITSPDPDDPSSASLGRTWFGENDLWLEVAARLGSAHVSGGYTRYLYAGEAVGQVADAVDTAELYAAAYLNAGPTVPHVAVWYDVDRVRGSYVETGADLRVPVLPSHEPILGLYLSALAGWSVGQEIDPDEPDEAAYFSGGGLTHIDLGLELTAGSASRYGTFEAHLLLARGGGARRPSPGNTQPGESWWIGLGLSDAVVIGIF